jgi:hypothetical protein
MGCLKKALLCQGFAGKQMQSGEGEGEITSDLYGREPSLE